MKVGLLIFDNDSKRSIEEKIRLAAERYKAKHGQAADTCYVHPNTLGEAPVKLNLNIVAAKNILPHHFWVGVSENQMPERIAA